MRNGRIAYHSSGDGGTDIYIRDLAVLPRDVVDLGPGNARDGWVGALLAAVGLVRRTQSERLSYVRGALLLR